MFMRQFYVAQGVASCFFVVPCIFYVYIIAITLPCYVLFQNYAQNRPYILRLLFTVRSTGSDDINVISIVDKSLSLFFFSV